MILAAVRMVLLWPQIYHDYSASCLQAIIRLLMVSILAQVEPAGSPDVTGPLDRLHDRIERRREKDWDETPDKPHEDSSRRKDRPVRNFFARLLSGALGLIEFPTRLEFHIFIVLMSVLALSFLRLCYVAIWKPNHES